MCEYVLFFLIVVPNTCVGNPGTRGAGLGSPEGSRRPQPKILQKQKTKAKRAAFPGNTAQKKNCQCVFLQRRWEL